MTYPSQVPGARSEYWREYYLNHKSETVKKVNAWRLANRKRSRANVRRGELKRKYNITPEEYEAMLERQGGVCDICHQVCRSGRRLAVDHCHSSGKVRGLLCIKCNTTVGWLEGDPELLMPAIEYLKRNVKPPEEAELPISY